MAVDSERFYEACDEAMGAEFSAEEEVTTSEISAHQRLHLVPDPAENNPVEFDEPQADDDVDLTDSLRLFFNESLKYKRLTWPQEIRLFRRIEQGDSAAKEEMVTSNLGLVISIAKRFQGYGISLEDLIQDGIIGLHQAIDKFDYRQGNKFSTYATPWVWRHITRAIDDKSRTIRIPVYMGVRTRKVNRAEQSLHDKLRRRPNLYELVEATGLEPSQIEEVKKVPLPPISLDAPVNDENEGGYANFVADRTLILPDEAVEQVLRSDALNKALDELSARERQVLQLYFGLDEQPEVSTNEIARLLGVTNTRIDQIRKRAIEKLMGDDELKAAVAEPEARESQADELEPLDVALPDGRVITLEADEQKVFKLFGRTSNRAQIAKRAGISHPRVQAATNSICRKLEVDNKVQAAPIVLEALKSLTKK